MLHSFLQGQCDMVARGQFLGPDCLWANPRSITYGRGLGQALSCVPAAPDRWVMVTVPTSLNGFSVDCMDVTALSTVLAT